MGDLDFDAMEEQAGRIIVGSLIPESSRCFWIDNLDGSCYIVVVGVDIQMVGPTETMTNCEDGATFISRNCCDSE